MCVCLDRSRDLSNACNHVYGCWPCMEHEVWKLTVCCIGRNRDMDSGCICVSVFIRSHECDFVLCYITWLM